MYNPRWPHTFTIVGETFDENGLPITDENGDAVVEPVSVLRIQYDGEWNPRYDLSGNFLTEEITEIPWGYRTSTGGIKDAGDVTVADYKISCPMLLSDIPTGTHIIMTDYTRTFHCRVVKHTTYNWGTNLWVDNIKN